MAEFTDRLWSDLVRDHGAALAHADRPQASRRRLLRRPRVLAGTSLGLAGAGTALAILLTAAGTAPAYAVTRQPDGTVLVSVNVAQSTQPWVQGADQKLASMGINEQIMVSMAPGPATVDGPVSCTPLDGASTPVQVMLGTDGTQVIPANITGAGTVHLGSCLYFPTPAPGAGNTGNTGGD